MQYAVDYEEVVLLDRTLARHSAPVLDDEYLLDFSDIGRSGSGWSFECEIGDLVPNEQLERVDCAIEELVDWCQRKFSGPWKMTLKRLCMVQTDFGINGPSEDVSTSYPVSITLDTTTLSDAARFKMTAWYFGLQV